MKWFDKWFSKQCKKAWNYRDESDDAEPSYSTRPKATLISRGSMHDSSINCSSSRMNFTMYKASGGLVIETQHIDRRTENHVTSLHIITEDKNLGEELGKIITYESLKL